MSGIMSMVLGAKTAIAAAVDAYFNLVTLLLPGDGTNGAQNNTFLDSSSNNFTITRNGNTTQGTFTPFSQTGWGNYFDGSGDYLSVPDNDALDLTGDFTIECWVYLTNVSPGYNPTVVARWGASGGQIYTMQVQNGGTFRIITSAGTWTGGSVSANTWTHLAISRSGSSLRLFNNGTLQSTNTDSTSLSGTQVTSIGGESDGAQSVPGYISNVRILKGTAQYTASFTPPTAQLTAITNTSLLTCQSNRFVDNSSNAFTITVGGTPSVQAFSPFAPTAAYSAATNGGSGYFDGTGDYLTIARNTAFIPTTGDFTFEAWVYPLNTNAAIIAGLQETGTGADWNFFIASDSTIGLFAGNGSGQLNSTQTVKANQWNHCVASRSGSTLYIGCNGALTSGTFTNSLDNGQSYPLSIGADQNGDENNLTGYMSGLRLIKGSAQYTSTTYTVPTAPPTAITNTAVLLNYTNAGITDATAKNVLETVGNAQISTTQSKFGGSSMYFDGTGDYLLIPSSNVNRPLFDFGSGNWTVEFWVNWTTAPSATTEFRLWWSSVRSTGVARLDLYIYNNIVYAGWSGTNVLDSGSLSWNTGQWYHMAFVRSGNSWAAFRDGTRIASATNSTTLVSSPAKIIGENVNAYIDDFRVTTGYARYDPSQTTVTIPTAAFGLQ